MDSEPLTIRRSAHGPVVAEEEGEPVALRVAGTARPRMLEQFWRMGLARNLEQFHAAMAMQQLPLFNTMYGDRDGHIMYLYNAALPLREPADERFWRGPVPGNDSSLIWSSAVVPYAELPKVIDPPGGWVQNCNDSPWTCTHPMVLDPADWTPQIAPEPSHTPRAMRSIRLLSQAGKISLGDLKAMKLSTRVELADHFVDDLAAAAERLGGRAGAARRGGPAAVGPRHRQRQRRRAPLPPLPDRGRDELQEIGGSRVPADPAEPLTTPRGFAAPERAVTALDAAAEDLEREYGTCRYAGATRCACAAAPWTCPETAHRARWGRSARPAWGPFVDGKAQIVSGDTFYAVVEFSDAVRGEALLGYGNWSRAGSKHVTDQLELASQKRMRPILRTRREIEAALEHRQELEPD